MNFNDFLNNLDSAILQDHALFEQVMNESTASDEDYQEKLIAAIYLDSQAQTLKILAQYHEWLLKQLQN